MSYDRIKKYLLRAIPIRFLYWLEPALRFIHALKFSGNNVHCNVCNKSHNRFVALGNDQLCPRCGSIARNRRLWQLISELDLIKEEATLLDFSPSRCLYRKLKSQSVRYVSTDLSNNFMANNQYDITDLPLSNDSVDIILCYHILEHVPADEKAMSELQRVLKPNGVCLVQTPFKTGHIYENWDITSPEGRLDHFGQEDHVRIYSLQGLKSRLENVGFHVSVLEFSEEPENRLGLAKHEIVLKCHKTP